VRDRDHPVKVRECGEALGRKRARDRGGGTRGAVDGGDERDVIARAHLAVRAGESRERYAWGLGDERVDDPVGIVGGKVAQRELWV